MKEGEVREMIGKFERLLGYNVGNELREINLRESSQPIIKRSLLPKRKLIGYFLTKSNQVLYFGQKKDN